MEHSQPIPQRPPLGPRPLALHIAMMGAFSMSSIAALPSLKSDSPFWKEACRAKADELRLKLALVDDRRFAAAVERELRNRQHRFALGVRRYRSFDRPQREPAYAVRWRTGSTLLRDYGGDGPVILIVPSLVNRCDVLDLGCGRSFTEALMRDGHRPLLVDWSAPGEEERGFGLSDYITERLEPALDEALALSGGRAVVVAGYCMGGCLALALALRRQKDVAGLALLATPWDFHAGDRSQLDMLAASLPALDRTIDALGELPVDMLQAMFTGLDPWLTPAKFIRFAGLDSDSAEAALFVALEDWLNDGVPLVSNVARECLRGWYVDNETAHGKWAVAGEPVRPDTLRIPTIAFIPGRDHIVPPPSARALADAIPGCDSRTVPAGHIGMVAGSRARKVLIEPLETWIAEVQGKN